MGSSIHVHDLKAAALNAGLTLCSVISTDDAEQFSTQSYKYLQRWLSKGFAGEMRYLNKRSSRFNQPKSFLSGAQSLVVFLVPYSPSPGPIDHQPRLGYARVARYAWGEDYHVVIKRRLKNLVRVLAKAPGIKEKIDYRVFTDSAPIFERTLGEASKLGFVGKNTLLITPRTGSYNFIATIVWDVDVKGEIVPEVKLSSCGDCINCGSHCPTGAILEGGIIDATRCVSYLTIERKTAFTSAEMPLLQDWAFGCDVCQQVCPFNNQGNTVDVWDEFKPECGAGPWINLLEAFELRTADEFARRYEGSPVMRAGRECFLRNCISVAANTHFAEAIGPLQSLATHDDSPYVRFHAKLALRTLHH